MVIVVPATLSTTSLLQKPLLKIYIYIYYKINILCAIIHAQKLYRLASNATTAGGMDGIGDVVVLPDTTSSGSAFIDARLIQEAIFLSKAISSRVRVCSSNSSVSYLRMVSSKNKNV